MTYTDDFIPSGEAALVAASLIEAHHTGNQVAFASLFLTANREVMHALVAYADLATRGFAQLAETTHTDVLQQLRLTVTEVLAELANEGEE